MTTEQNKDSSLGRFIGWLVSRNGLLWIWITIVSAGLVGALYWHFEREAIFNTLDDWLWLAAGSAVLIGLPLVALSMDPVDNYAKGPRARLSFVTLALLTALLTAAILDQKLNINWLSSHPVAIVAFFSFFVSAIIPRFWNAANFALYDEERRKAARKQARTAYINEQRERYPNLDVETIAAQIDEGNGNDGAASIGSLIVTLAVLAIGTAAYFAGDGANLSLESSFGFFLCFSFVGLFIVIVFFDVISELPAVRGLGSGLDGLAVIGRPLAAFYKAVDEFLVHLCAPVLGISHRDTTLRYVVIIGTMLVLSLMGLYLPSPYGLIPTFLGFGLAIAVSRTWNWVEEDRALAALTNYKATAPYQTDMREDYLDETLLAFAFVFLLAPIAMMQANGTVPGNAAIPGAAVYRIEDWVAFFGIQLANTLPVLSWGQIYGIQTLSDIAVDSASSRHAVFLSRIMIDLVLIAALIQAIGILTRTRQQKALYRAGHIDRLDPFVERIEFARAMKVAEVAGSDRQFDLLRLKSKELIDFRRYSENRLRALYALEKDKTKRKFIEDIAKPRDIPLGSAIDNAADLAGSNGNAVDLINTFARAIEEHYAGGDQVEPLDLQIILSGLIARTGLRDFKQRVVDVLERIASPAEVVEILSDLVEGPGRDHFVYARTYMAAAIERAKKKLSGD